MISTAKVEETPSTLQVNKSVLIDAPVQTVFESILEQLGPASEMQDGKPLPMVLEAWPGGRWFRDLGEGQGHLWGHVQVIKPPALIEICGPLFMSYPAVSHIQYRVTEEGNRTRLDFLHRAMGLLDPDHCEGVHQGWEHHLERIKHQSE